jgi:3-methylfumaryl-CoA hydratase
MRYSALTFNSHRIHYDAPYATEVEGYPGLVVHGPLIATLLLDAARRERPGAFVQAFAFKAMRPLICGQRFTVNGAMRAGGSQPLGRRRGVERSPASERATGTMISVC